ncbi:MAG: 7-cyano-7-deazaguanine synthase QueC [Desulfobacteraceae bacterium 4572_35.1]|nr:MAG: 7-cyano-7-deazaguanine synthase QueC [Desulfobacteraceae bacterium 4572_35.1]
MAEKAIVLYSSGLDSTTCMAIAKQDGFTPIALSFSYGQRHSVELEKAQKYAQLVGAAKHIIVDIDLKQIGGSALTADIEVPKDRLEDEQIPVTYVPARNTIFLSYALAWAEVLNVFDIYIGVNALDYSGYPDCRPEFISAFEQMANLATKAAVDGKELIRIHTPLLQLTKAQIIATGLELGVDYGLTHSCYDPDATGRACGHCDSCILRLKGFAEAGQRDPVAYVGGK